MTERKPRRQRRVSIPPALAGYLLGMVGTVLLALALLVSASDHLALGIILAAVAVALFAIGYAAYRRLRAAVTDPEARAATATAQRHTYEKTYPHSDSEL